MSENQKPARIFCAILLSMAVLICPLAEMQAGGGLVLEDDVCMLRIDFYSAHFTAYQPDTSGNEQFCESLPDMGATIFVLDYLHQSLKEVPVSFRIIRDVTGLGRFVKLKHVQSIEVIDQHTVFYQPPVIRTDASLTVEYDFIEEGAYIVIVTAGHPTNDQTYTSVFPFEVGSPGLDFRIIVALFLVIAAIFMLIRYRRARSRALQSKTSKGEPTP